uniref:Uncharacterized protein n=1 Tax=Oryza nivara TaxID=4536 RepID=A0A0E0HZ22_ORYNI
MPREPSPMRSCRVPDGRVQIRSMAAQVRQQMFGPLLSTTATVDWNAQGSPPMGPPHGVSPRLWAARLRVAPEALEARLHAWARRLRRPLLLMSSHRRRIADA